MPGWGGTISKGFSLRIKFKAESRFRIAVEKDLQRGEGRSIMEKESLHGSHSTLNICPQKQM